MVGVAAVVGSSWLVASGPVNTGVQPLSAAEADARKVGLCDYWCSNRTLGCPTAARPFDWCTGLPRNLCLSGGPNQACWICSLNANFRMCDPRKGSNCTIWGSANQTCGFQKKVGCTWNGTACLCQPWPANFSLAGCEPRDCN